MNLRRTLALGVMTLASCGSTRWPDERGMPVPLGYAENVSAEEAFVEALTAARAGTTLPAPTLTPSFAAKLRKLAGSLQRGEASAPAALAEAKRWGRAAYRREVEAWVLDCRDGVRMSLPSALTSPPVLAISFAASHFRPRSSREIQCAILVVSASGTERGARLPEDAPPP